MTAVTATTVASRLAAALLHHAGVRRMVVALSLVSGSVRAEPRVGESPFATLDRIDGNSRARFDLSIVQGVIDDSGGGDPDPRNFTLARIEIHAQLVNQHGLGVYGAFGIVEAFTEGRPHERLLPAPEIGVLYARRIHPSVDLVTHAGAALSPKGEFVDRLLLPGGHARISDFARNLDDGSWFRLATSPVVHYRSLVFRADLGVDVRLGDPQPAFVFSREGPLYRLGVGAGFKHCVHHFAVEYTVFMDASRTRGYQKQYQTAAATYRLQLGKTAPFAAVVLPLARPRDTSDPLVDGSVMIGIDLVH